MQRCNVAVQRIELPEKLPYFAELPYYLWGQVNYDSDGDCRRPTDREWTWMHLEHRGTGDVVELRQEEGECLLELEGDDPTIARLAMFLIDRCGGAGNDKMSERAAPWDHEAAYARTVQIQSEFERPELVPFDSHLFWGSWKWIGWYATEYTWVGRWIMHSVVRNDPRAIPLCIDWIKQTQFPEQAAALSYAVQRLSGDSARNPSDWVRWYEGSWFKKGAKYRFPEPEIKAWLAELKSQYGEVGCA
jgi:hypothetical protein